MRPFLFGVALVIAACGGKQSSTRPLDNTAVEPAAPPPAAPQRATASDVIAKMQGFSDGICACTDKPCVDKVTDDMARWGQEQARLAGESSSPPVSEDDTKKIVAITETMTRCMTQIMSADAPPAK